ncbi:hypothetical protein ACHAXM_008429 [Skeletonema potamos]|jgi:hypothetical protein
MPLYRHRVTAAAVLMVVLALAATPITSSALVSFFDQPHRRSSFITKVVGLVMQPDSLVAFISDTKIGTNSHSLSSPSASMSDDSSIVEKRTVVYQPLSVTVCGVEVPVAAWHPPLKDSTTTIITRPLESYQHRISVQKIGKNLAGWNFIPTFANRNFALRPSVQNSNVDVVTTEQEQFPSSTPLPVIILAHGYLGSRFDLYHLAEQLASKGFLVFAPEYPESLADSFDATIKDTNTGEIQNIIDRDMITNELILTLQQTWKVTPTSFGIVGHSLGCGTAERSGDDSWTRVCLAGFPSSRSNGSRCLFIGSTNDGAVSVNRALSVLRECNYVNLDEDMIRSIIAEKQQLPTIPSKAALIFSGVDAPNHISFLSEETNNAMVDFLSPLLPLARAIRIPVLDFDKYQLSRDSRACGDVVIPLVIGYLKQNMKV